MPAQSPTLSPTLSAMVAALRGSSSGMPASTLPTRSAPTSAALVKMPPPTRMNRASSEAPKAKPMRTAVAEFWKISTMAVAPTRPSPTQSMPVTAPVRKATRSAPAMPPPLDAAAAVRTLPRTAMLMPMKPVRPEKAAPKRKQIDPVEAVLGEGQGDVPVGLHHLGGGEEDEDGQGTTMMAMVRNWRLRNASAPSWTARAISRILGVPVSAASTLRASRRPAAMPTTPATRQM